MRGTFRHSRRGSALIVIALAVAACGGASGTSSSSSTITVRVGYIGPLTGSSAQLGTETQDAGQLAVDQLNAKGGITVNGTKIKIQMVSEDEGDRTTDGAVAGAERLIDQDNVTAIVGGVNSSGILAYMPIIQKAQIPMIDTVGKASTIPTTIVSKNMNYIWVANPVSASLAETHVAAWKSLVKPKKIYFLQINTDATHDLESAFKNEMAKQGLVAETQSSYVEANVNDFGPYILKIKQFQPDLIWVSLLGNPVYSFARQLAQSGYTSGYVLDGDGEYGSSKFLAQEGQDANLAMVNAVTFPTSVTPLSMPFYDSYKAQFNISPAAYYAVDEYDGMLAFFEAIRRSGGLNGDLKHDRKAVETGLGKLTPSNPFVGVRSAKEYFLGVDQGHREPVPLVITQIQNGHYAVVWPPDAAKSADGKFIDPRQR